MLEENGQRTEAGAFLPDRILAVAGSVTFILRGMYSLGYEAYFWLAAPCFDKLLDELIYDLLLYGGIVLGVVLGYRVRKWPRRSLRPLYLAALVLLPFALIEHSRAICNVVPLSP